MDVTGDRDRLKRDCAANPDWAIGSGNKLDSGSSPGVKPTTYRHLVPRLSLSGAVPPLPYMPSWHGA